MICVANKTVHCWQCAHIVNNDTREIHKQQQQVVGCWMVNPCIPCCDCPELLCWHELCYQPGLCVVSSCCVEISPQQHCGKKSVRFHSFQKQSLQWSNEQIKTERGARSKDSDWRSMVFTLKAQKSPEVSFFISCRQLATHWWRNVPDQLRPDHRCVLLSLHFTSIQVQGGFTLFLSLHL